MELVFTKGAGKNDHLVMHRADGAREEIVCPKQGIIPHDMMHYAVESGLQARGFLGRVKDGENARFGMAPEAESDSIERLVEVMQGENWSGPVPVDELIDLYRVTCTARGCPMLELDAGIIRDVRQRIASLTSRWESIPIGQTLTLTL
ncbi:MAG: hypothetical protein JWL66_375 [Sphingomonadales bacterium]|nr:hypothetical protein [Sphingomonadales bacterium]